MVLQLDDALGSFLDGNLHEKFLEYGIIPILIDIFKSLQQEPVKPDDPLRYLRQQLGGVDVTPEDIANLERELEDAHRELRRLKAILRRLEADKSVMAVALATD